MGNDSMNDVPQELGNWELFESDYGFNYTTLMFRHKSGRVWCVLQQAAEGDQLATLFIPREGAPKFISVEAQGLIGAVNDLLDWDLDRINQTTVGGARTAYYFAGIN